MNKLALPPLQFSLVCLLNSRRTVLWVKMPCFLFVIPATDSHCITFPLFTQDITHLLLWPCASYGKYETCIHDHFHEFLTTNGWKGDIQLHLVIANPRRCHQRVLDFLMVVILTKVIWLSLMSKDIEHFFMDLLATCTVIIILRVFVPDILTFWILLYSGL